MFQKLENSILFRIDGLESKITNKFNKLDERVTLLEELIQQNDEIINSDIQKIQKFLPSALGQLHAAFVKNGIDNSRFGGNSENAKLFKRLNELEGNLSENMIERFNRIDRKTQEIHEKTKKLPFR